MFSNVACSYSFDAKTRCIESVSGEKDRHLFFVGTNSLREETNRVFCVEFCEDKNSLEKVCSLNVKNEVWCIAPNPEKATDLFVVRNDGRGYSASWLRVDSLSAEDVEVPLEPEVVCTFDKINSEEGTIKSMHWSLKTENQCLSVQGQKNTLWDIGESGAKVVGEYSSEPSDGASGFSAAVWDPHHSNEVAFANSEGLYALDTRTMECTRTVENEHSKDILSLDFNPNRPFYIVSGGEDGRIKFWDIRQGGEPLSILSGHSHWVTNVRYNPFHDQLVLSASTDANACLWRVSSISSAPLLELDDEADHADSGDALIECYDEQHEDSLYSACFSACDAWIFGTLSYDGFMFVNHVPSAEKYKILL